MEASGTAIERVEALFSGISLAEAKPHHVALEALFRLATSLSDADLDSLLTEALADKPERSNDVALMVAKVFVAVADPVRLSQMLHHPRARVHSKVVTALKQSKVRDAMLQLDEAQATKVAVNIKRASVSVQQSMTMSLLNATNSPVARVLTTHPDLVPVLRAPEDFTVALTREEAAQALVPSLPVLLNEDTEGRKKFDRIRQTASEVNLFRHQGICTRVAERVLTLVDAVIDRRMPKEKTNKARHDQGQRSAIRDINTLLAFYGDHLYTCTVPTETDREPFILAFCGRVSPILSVNQLQSLLRVDTLAPVAQQHIHNAAKQGFGRTTYVSSCGYGRSGAVLETLHLTMAHMPVTLFDRIGLFDPSATAFDAVGSLLVPRLPLIVHEMGASAVLVPPLLRHLGLTEAAEAFAEALVTSPMQISPLLR
ncbi:hypothetical protein KIPB_006901 [Kipferlia bialata]|uniref:Uncharacterized protein n=1 Tax=Kipferlia bialata TaxID=797122 RepID=A0A9K3CYF9_9EUKA|nr:hypothetical protein KIPB_006901 [Kipferlia bialata]|eukprot:g6901.t1